MDYIRRTGNNAARTENHSRAGGAVSENPLVLNGFCGLLLWGNLYVIVG